MFGKLKFFRLALLLALAMIAGNISAQTIKGTVTDSSGETIIGATVMETGTQNGVVTDSWWSSVMVRYARRTSPVR